MFRNSAIASSSVRVRPLWDRFFFQVRVPHPFVVALPCTSLPPSGHHPPSEMTNSAYVAPRAGARGLLRDAGLSRRCTNRRGVSVPTEWGDIARFVSLLNWTDQGGKTASATVDRTEAAQKIAAEMRGSLEDFSTMNRSQRGGRRRFRRR